MDNKGGQQMKVMKDSGIAWIKEIPEGWEVVPFKSIYSLGKGLSITKADLVDTGVPVISYGQIHSKLNKGTCISDELIRYVPTSFLTDNDNSLVKEGDLIFADTSEDLEGCGNCVYIDRADTLFSGYHTIIARNKTNVKNNYISYLIKTDCWRMQLRSVVNGVKLFSIPQKTLATTSLIVPSIEEQQSIATYLDTKCAEIDELVALQDKMIEELKAYKQSVITEAVTKGLDFNAKMKYSGVEWIGEIPEGWEVKRLKNVVTAMDKGNGITKEEVFVNGNTPCVRYGEIYSKYNYSFNTCFSATNKEVLPTLRYFKYGDLLSAGTGELVEEIGKTIAYLGNDDCLAGGDIIIIKHNHNPLFLSYALNCHYAQAQKSCNKAKLKVVHISATDIADVILTIPPIEEQQQIATYLDTKCSEIDALIAIKQKKIEALKEYKKSLIYECVTGKKELI